MSLTPSIYGSLTRYGSTAITWLLCLSLDMILMVPLFLKLRKLFKVWNERAELPNKQLVRSLPYVFHDLDVYPSRSQVYEMIHCANDCSRRLNGDYLTFGEFCVYASELKTNYEEKTATPLPLSKCGIPEHRKVTLNQQTKDSINKTSEPKFEVFLGGSCNPTTWRTDIAIPILKSLGITYYNPQVAIWRPELIELEWSAKQNAEVLFIVIDNQTRAIVSMIEAAFMCGSQRNLILVFTETAGPGAFIHGEAISQNEYRDLKQSQSYLQDIVERHGIPIFDQMPVALSCVHRILREGIRPQDLSREDNAMPVRMAHIQLGDKLIRLREAFDSLDSDKTGEISLTDLRLAFRMLTGRELTNNNLRQIAIGRMDSLVMDCDSEFKTINLDETVINFEEFCCIVTEFKSQITTNEKFAQLLAKKLVSIVEPIQRLLAWLWQPVRNAFNCPPEAAAIERSRVLLFTITGTTRGLSAMILAGHYVAMGCNVVLCIQNLEDDCVIDGEKLTPTAVKDYNRGRAYLSDMTTRMGLPVFDDIREAVEIWAKFLRMSVKNEMSTQNKSQLSLSSMDSVPELSSDGSDGSNDWANRQFIETLTTGIQKITNFLNKFDKTCKEKLSSLNQRLTTTEKTVTYLETYYSNPQSIERLRESQKQHEV
ncbi:unnamed protein product [Medioppia subpectinata]|uniref:EF-hand domain-containing protein n=1 Tax=Medioppia subpectinata TaxID=1979941 RepID=A0A7R9PW59_9ACAR|nr:unnamed protein product [Medioppia subpectinata]CAG2102544.1 unnamed protein product [Medioppia subpectinata]